MRHRTEMLADRITGPRRRALVIAVALAAPLLSLGTASPALALSKQAKEEFLPFIHCPLSTAALCVVANTTGGEFVIGSKTLPLSKPILLQGGLGENSYGAQPLIAAVEAPTLALVPEEVPGGLAGIGGIGGEVTATAEIAGPVSSVIINRDDLVLHKGAAVTLPVKVKLTNEYLGDNCYIGSAAEPIVLHLTSGTTDPPAGVEPITGSLTPLEGGAKGKITKIKTTKLVDNTFPVPAASGCGPTELLYPVVDEVLDADIGLPAEAGKNTAIMTGSLEETTAEFAHKYLPKTKKKKK